MAQPIGVRSQKGWLFPRMTATLGDDVQRWRERYAKKLSAVKERPSLIGRPLNVVDVPGDEDADAEAYRHRGGAPDAVPEAGRVGVAVDCVRATTAQPTSESHCFRSRLGLSNFDRGLVGPIGCLEAGFELCWR
jgi:hypothetical protein